MNPAFVINTQGIGNQALQLPVADKNTRAEKPASAHFLLPAAWITAGPKKFAVEGDSVALQDSEDQAPPDNNDCSVTVNFQAQKPMVLHLIRTKFKTNAGITYETDSADLVAVAPASANTIAKLAHGLADNLLTVTALAARCPLLIAPAMDGGMYTHPATQANLEILRGRGAIIAGPAAGHLASGLEG